MQIKRLVNDKPLWDAFNVELDERIAFCHRQLELLTDTAEIHRMQGEVKALRNLKQLRDKVNGAQPETY